MLRLIFLFCSFTTICYSQVSDYVWFSHKMGFLGYTAIDQNGNKRFDIEDHNCINFSTDPQGTFNKNHRIKNFDFNTGLLPIYKQGSHRLINVNGKEVVDLKNKYSKIYFPSCSIMVVKLKNKESNKPRYAFLDSKGRELFEHHTFYSATAFRDNISIVQYYRRGSYNIIDKKGNKIGSLKYKVNKLTHQIHSINDGRIVVTFKKRKLFSKSFPEDLIMVFDYNGNVIFSTKYNKAENRYAKLRFNKGFMIVKSNKTNIYYDKHGNLIKSLPKDMSLIQTSKDYLLFSGNSHPRKLYNINFEEVKIPVFNKEFESFISAISDEGITIYYSKPNDKKEGFYQIYEPKTFNKIFYSKKAKNELILKKDKILEFSSYSTIKNIYNLQGDTLFKISDFDKTYLSLKEALCSPEKVQYLRLSDIDDLDGLQDLTKLKGLAISDYSLSKLPNFESIKELKYLFLNDCYNLTELPKGITNTKLKYLHTRSTYNLKLKTIIPDLKYLKEVYVDHNVKIDKDYQDLLNYLRPDIKIKKVFGGSYEKINLK